MTFDNVRKQHEHFSKLAQGDFTARTFDTTTAGKNEGDEEGNLRMGKLTAERISLIKSDALVAKLEIEEKYPQLKEAPKEISKKKPKDKEAA